MKSGAGIVIGKMFTPIIGLSIFIFGIVLSRWYYLWFIDMVRFFRMKAAKGPVV